jgi:hypothetical protein
VFRRERILREQAEKVDEVGPGLDWMSPARRSKDRIKWLLGRRKRERGEVAKKAIGMVLRDWY